MPIYAYRCQACGHEFDAMQKMSDSPLTQCPECHKDELKKQLTAPAFRLSGSGWYETDFKKDKRKNLAGDASSSDSSKADKPAAETKSTESKATESKPANAKPAASAS